MGNGGRDLGLLRRLGRAAGLSALATATLGSGPCGSCDEPYDDCSSLEGLKIARDRGLARLRVGQPSGRPALPGSQEEIAQAWDGSSCPTVEERQAIGHVDGQYLDGRVSVLPSEEGQCCYRITPICGEGRPFLVGGQARVAVLLGLDSVDSSHEATFDGPAAEWLGDALAEHASVASFARLTLQLMALGAPAELVRDSQVASLDELRHTDFCFEMASRYAGRRLLPGPLSVEGALDDLSLAGLIECNLREGCIGETLAARELERRAEQTLDPELRRALLAIREDELRHAELAFRIHAWCREVAPDLAAPTVARILTEPPPRDRSTWDGLLQPLLSALAA